MNESILNALMHLFALMAVLNEKKATERGRNVIIQFLEQHLPRLHADEYLKYFDNHVELYKKRLNKETAPAKPNYHEVENICDQMNNNLNQTERYLAYIRLVEFVQEDGIINTMEEKFIHVVGNIFSIPEDEKETIKRFLFGKVEDEKTRKRTLFFTGDPGDKSEELEGAWIEKNRPSNFEVDNRRFLENMVGNLYILHVPTLNLFCFYYKGKKALRTQNHDVLPGRVYLLENGMKIMAEGIPDIKYDSIANHFLKTLEKASIILQAGNISLHKKGKTRVHPFHLHENTGHLVGILTHYPDERTLLLKMLSGIIKPSTGNITLNGYDINKDKYKVQGLIGYVPSKSILFEEFTVYENLYYNASISLGKLSASDIREQVDKYLRKLNLWEIKNVKVKKLQGVPQGKRWLLSIGMELVREPSVLIIDEPEEKIAPYHAGKLIKILKELVLEGKLIITSIQFPSSLSLKTLDKVLILDEGGYIIYHGNPREALLYFKTNHLPLKSSGSECPTCGNIEGDKILYHVESNKIDEAGNYTPERKTKPHEWYGKYKQQAKLDSPPQVKKTIPFTLTRLPNIPRQFWVIARGNFISTLRNKKEIMIHLTLAPLLALLFSIISRHKSGNDYFFGLNDNIPQFLFISTVAAFLMGLLSGIIAFRREKEAIEKDVLLHLSWFSFINAKMFFLCCISILQVLVYVAICHWVLGIHMVIGFFLVLFSITITGNLTGMYISSFPVSITVKSLLISMIIVAQLLLGGTVIPYMNLPGNTNPRHVPIAGNLMPARWAYEALMVEQFKKNEYGNDFYPLEKTIHEASFITGILVPRLLEITTMLKQHQDKLLQRDKLQDLNILQHEIEWLGEREGIFPFEYISEISNSNYNAELLEELDAYLTYVKIHFFERSGETQEKIETIKKQYIKTMGPKGFKHFMNTHFNQAVAKLVTREDEPLVIYETGNTIFQNHDPIYTYPGNNFGRAHFYAPVKKFNFQYIDTIWFNIAILWLFSLVFYSMLMLMPYRRNFSL
jgi:ABC-type multidrug transport system ATPase subunit